MAELLSVEADGSLKRQAASEHIFDVYTKKEELGGRQTYSCSVGTKWSDIHINYHDGETLTIWKRGESPIAVSYVALGMVNEKNNMPNKGFKFLATTLMTGTQSLPVPAKTAVGYQALVQRKREINKSLKAFFPDIQDEDPIVFDSKNQCYQLRFKSRSI